ncbi:MAG: hypothetical protein R6V85_04360 [Polyangia bacterium]
MIRRVMVQTELVCGLAIVFGFGCGSAKTEVDNQGGSKASQPAPFADADLKGGKSKYGDIELSEKDETIEVPGSQYGEAPPVETAKKKKRGRRGKKTASEPTIPYSDAISEQMEGLQWGMTWKRVMSTFQERIDEEFADELAATAGDALEEDRVRTKMLRETKKLRDSYIEFTGQRTGYESGMIADEFTHNNGESMLMWDAGKYVEYLFFFDGRLWKRLRAFRKDSFQSDIDFMTFLSTLENRFGEGQQFFTDTGELDKVMWRDEETYAAALDRSKFYGAFGLRFTSAITATYLDKLRTGQGRARGKVGDDVSEMVDTVTSVKSETKDHDSSVIDSYTGGSSAPSDSSVGTEQSASSGKKKKEEKEEEEEQEQEQAPEADEDLIDDLF